MRNAIVKYILVFAAAVFFYWCSSSYVAEKSGYIPATAANGFSNPRNVEGELIVHIRNIKVLKGDSLKSWNADHSIPADQSPLLLLWSSDIKDHTGQRNVRALGYMPAPSDIFTEDENGNRICFWDLSDQLKDADSITVKRKFSFTAYDYKPDINENAVAENCNKIPPQILKFYTKPEYLLEQTPEIKNTSAEITAGITNPVEKARAVFNFVRDTMKYVYPPESRGAAAALKTCKGDCGQYSALFIALARAAGIPARQQSGFVFMPGNTGYHVWSEIYLPGYDWVPVDATKKDGFCHLDNTRLIASVGMNIPIRYAPKWATYSNSEVDNNTIDFMQLVSTVMSGVKANISTDLIVLKSDAAK